MPVRDRFAVHLPGEEHVPDERALERDRARKRDLTARASMRAPIRSLIGRRKRSRSSGSFASQGQLAPIGCATRSHAEPCPMALECSLRFMWEEVRRDHQDPRRYHVRRAGETSRRAMARPTADRLSRTLDRTPRSAAGHASLGGHIPGRYLASFVTGRYWGVNVPHRDRVPDSPFAIPHRTAAAYSSSPDG